MDILQKLYALSPNWARTIGLNLYAIKNNFVNYGMENRKFLKTIEQYRNADLSSIYQYQLRELNKILELSQRTRHYRTEKPITTGSLAETLYRLPILEKSTVRSDPSAFVVSPLHHPLRLHTSGTSGTPLDIVCSRPARAKNYAFYRAMLRENGCDYRDRSVTFAGRKIIPAGTSSPPYWIADHVTRTLYCSSYHLSNTSAIEYVAAISKWQPRYIDTYPSAIHDLACMIEENNIKHGINPKVIFTSSETLFEHQRITIQRVFGCPVVDHYGCTEMSVYAAQSITNDEYEAAPLFGIIEVINDQGCPAEPGQEGEIICTGFINEYMPLLRYRIGDRVLVGKTKDINDFRYYSLRRILGREDDTIITPEGRKVGRLDPAFKGIGGIRAAQIHQTHKDRIVIRLEKAIPEARIDIRGLTENIQERTSRQMKIDVEIVEQIARSQNGKFKAVVSDLDRRKR